MRKFYLLILILILALGGCTRDFKDEVKKQDDIPIQENTDELKEAEIKMLPIKSSNFQSVVGWLGEFEIAYIEKESDAYHLKSFDIRSGVSKTIYTENSLIIDVLIHPSKKFILLHTGSESTSAEVKLITTDGLVQNELTIESSELSIQWNDMNPSLLLLTAFREDWTFDLFYFDTTESDLVLLPIKDPFPKWLGQTKIIYSSEPSPLTGSNSIVSFDAFTGNQQQMDVGDLLFFDTYNDHLLMSERVGEEVHYTILSNDNIVESVWTAPFSGDTSEGFEPKIDWISNTELIFHTTQSNPTSVTSDSTQILIHITTGGQTVNSLVIDSTSSSCSPTGQWCLIGEQSESLFSLKTNQKKPWVSFIN